MFDVLEVDAPASISRRDYFVGVVLQGLMVRHPTWSVLDLVGRACTEADIVLNELERAPVD